MPSTKKWPKNKNHCITLLMVILKGRIQFQIVVQVSPPLVSFTLDPWILKNFCFFFYAIVEEANKNQHAFFPTNTSLQSLQLSATQMFHISTLWCSTPYGRSSCDSSVMTHEADFPNTMETCIASILASLAPTLATF